MKNNLLLLFLTIVLICIGYFVGSFITSAFSSEVILIEGDYTTYWNNTNSDIIIYTKDGCGACKKALNYLEKMQIKHDRRAIEIAPYNKDFKSIGVPYTPLILIQKKYLIVGFQQSILENQLAKLE